MEATADRSLIRKFTIDVWCPLAGVEAFALVGAGRPACQICGSTSHEPLAQLSH